LRFDGSATPAERLSAWFRYTRDLTDQVGAVWLARECLVAGAGGVDGAAGDGLVDVEVAVADFEVEAAVGVGADPGFVVDGGAL
jgi:hypothetical protein